MNISKYTNLSDETLQTFYSKSNGTLMNMGNTCYINTLIQSLLSLPSFTHFILSKDYEDRLNLNKSLEQSSLNLILELRDIFDLMHLQGYSLKPKKFLLILSKKFDYLDFHINQQNDLHEILTLIINQINIEIKFSSENVIQYFNKKILNNNEQYNDIRSIQINTYKNWYNHHKNEYSELTEMFFGQQISQIKCGNSDCNYIHHNYECFIEIFLDLDFITKQQSFNGEKYNYTLTDCIDEIFKPQFLNNNTDSNSESNSDSNSNKWKCDQCNTKTTSEQVIKFWKLPPILIISLKRFFYCPIRHHYMKNNNIIDIPIQLDMTNNVLNTLSQKKIKYTLQSVALHYGDINGGHYIALTRKSLDNNKWTFIDDLESQDLSQKEALIYMKKYAYILFYSLDN